MNDMIRDELRYAVWFDLTVDCAAAYGDRMAALRREFPGPAFPPHITVTSGLKGNEESIVKIFEELTVVARPASLHPGDCLVTGEFFRAVILPLPVLPTLADLRIAFRSRFGLDETATWQPHLSLLYGDFDDDQASELAKRSSGIRWPLVAIGGCSLWRLRGPVEDWRQVTNRDWTQG